MNTSLVLFAAIAVLSCAEASNPVLVGVCVTKQFFEGKKELDTILDQILVILTAEGKQDEVKKMMDDLHQEIITVPPRFMKEILASTVNILNFPTKIGEYVGSIGYKIMDVIECAKNTSPAVEEYLRDVDMDSYLKRQYEGCQKCQEHFSSNS